ncbi:MAG: ABC transporter ATP-binding protein [Eggerthellaceae bacterium]|nr:ABC transporter ATP-binding protein [Eggerthellaceae bacterium]
MAFLELRNVRKSYGEGDARTDVLRGISTQLEAGDLAVLLGPSGSGKSTFLNLVGGLENLDEGSIMVDGQDIASLSAREVGEYRRRQLGFVFQFYNLVPDLTVRENIEVCAHLSDDPLPMDDLLQSLGLWEQRRKFPRQISGGQQQRCAIGRALVKKPRLLLCDEPTGALDYQTSLEILDLMERVNRDFGCTLVVVTHNDAIARMATRILRLHDGMLVEDSVNPVRQAALSLEW